MAAVKQSGPRPDRVEIFAPGENTTRCLTATKPERQGEGQAHGEDGGEREGGTPSPISASYPCGYRREQKKEKTLIKPCI